MRSSIVVLVVACLSLVLGANVDEFCILPPRVSPSKVVYQHEVDLIQTQYALPWIGDSLEDLKRVMESCFNTRPILHVPSTITPEMIRIIGSHPAVLIVPVSMLRSPLSGFGLLAQLVNTSNIYIQTDSLDDDIAVLTNVFQTAVRFTGLVLNYGKTESNDDVYQKCLDYRRRQSSQQPSWHCIIDTSLNSKAGGAIGYPPSSVTRFDAQVIDGYLWLSLPGFSRDFKVLKPETFAAVWDEGYFVHFLGFPKIGSSENGQHSKDQQRNHVVIPWGKLIPTPVKKFWWCICFICRMFFALWNFV